MSGLFYDEYLAIPVEVLRELRSSFDWKLFESHKSVDV